MTKFLTHTRMIIIRSMVKNKNRGFGELHLTDLIKL
jgi:hypothetical protein